MLIFFGHGEFVDDLPQLRPGLIDQAGHAVRSVQNERDLNRASGRSIAGWWWIAIGLARRHSSRLGGYPGMAVGRRRRCAGLTERECQARDARSSNQNGRGLVVGFKERQVRPFLSRILALSTETSVTYRSSRHRLVDHCRTVDSERNQQLGPG